MIPPPPSGLDVRLLAKALNVQVVWVNYKQEDTNWGWDHREPGVFSTEEEEENYHPGNIGGCTEKEWEVRVGNEKIHRYKNYRIRDMVNSAILYLAQKEET